MPLVTEKIIATSIKLPPSLKAEIDHIAKKAGLSAHAFMLKTLTDATERARQREQFQHDSEQALQQVQASGLAFDAEDVQAYFTQKAAWRRGEAAPPLRPALKAWLGDGQTGSAPAQP